MSETVRYKGKVKKVVENGTPVQFYEALINALPDNFDNEKKMEIYSQYNYEMGYRELALDYHYNSFVFVGNDLYKVIENESMDSEYDFFESTKVAEDVFEFHVMYYNGGCSLDEAIEEALKEQ